jgi:hypothetical protein
MSDTGKKDFSYKLERKDFKREDKKHNSNNSKKEEKININS